MKDRGDLTSSEDRGQLVRGNDLELRIGAVGRALVAPPAPKLRRVPKAAALHMVVGYLDDELRADRLPRQILPLTPTTLHSRAPLRCIVGLGVRPTAPGMAIQC